jgi:hypothetical protein
MLQRALINLHIAPRASMLNCQNIFFQMRTHNFFNNFDKDFYSEKNNVDITSNTYIPKIQKKS